MKNVRTILIACVCAWCSSAQALTIDNLKTEYLTNPVGLEEQTPRFSWILMSDERGAKQDNYRIRVSSTPDGAADLWDSGTVHGAQTVNVVYEGKPLKSRQRCYWTVTVNGVESKQASWSMGLLDPDDWKAEWISFRDDTAFVASQTDVVTPRPTTIANRSLRRRLFSARPSTRPPSGFTS